MGETPRILVSHSARDRQLGGQIAEFLRSAVGAQLGSSSQLRPGEGLSELQHQLARADVVIGVITSNALDSGEVPFQLGAAWALGKRLVLLLRPDDGARELYLPMADAEAIVLGPDALIELGGSLAQRKLLESELPQAAREALIALFPDYVLHPSGVTTQQQWPLDENGVPRRSSVPEPPPPAKRTGLPSREASLSAGRAVSDCLFNREQGGPFAPELDAPFGAFLAALDGNWNTLRKLEDLDVWLEVADNLLEALEPGQEHVRFWYEVGFQLATLINLSGREVGGAADGAGFNDLWQGSLEALRISGRNAGIDTGALDHVTQLLENLRGPASERDYANLGRVQERMRELALGHDGAGASLPAEGASF